MFDGIGMCSSDHHDYLSQFINASRTFPRLDADDDDDDHIHCNPCFDLSLSSSLDNNITLEQLQGVEGERSVVVPWSNEEVVELFKFRSSMEYCSTSLPELISWGHVSRKLAEIGFKRTALECKEKFEQGKNLDNVISYKNSRVCNELDRFFLHDHPEGIIHQVSPDDCCPIMERKDNEAAVYHDQESADKTVAKLSENDKAAVKSSSQEDSEEQLARKKGKSKRKRKSGEAEALRGYFEAIVEKVMAQQEDLHNQLIASILERDKEKIAREEAWKIQEIKRSKTAMEMMAKDQANAEERQSTIIQFLKKFQDQQHIINTNKNVIQTDSSSARVLGLKTNPSAGASSPSSSSSISRRWPREEVLALINMRCKVSYSSSGSSSSGKGEGQMTGPLWERISQGMLELGYKRSAKRCKEKWENINKYFRKTKDGHKKRPVDARTCPYFHELSCLYSGNGKSALLVVVDDTPHPSGGGEEAQVHN